MKYLTCLLLTDSFLHNSQSITLNRIKFDDENPEVMGAEDYFNKIVLKHEYKKPKLDGFESWLNGKEEETTKSLPSPKKDLAKYSSINAKTKDTIKDKTNDKKP
jgi:hypothetical protein